MSPTADLQDAVLPTGVRLTEATTGDLGVISHLIRISGAYQGIYLAQVQDRQLSEDYLRSTLMRVARDDEGQVVGFYSIDTPGRAEPGSAELDWMIVRDDQQGRGLGRALLADAVTSTRSAGLASLLIVAHPPASAFYRRCGVVHVGVLAPEGKATWDRDIFRLPVR